MNSAPAPNVPPPSGTGLASWYTPGRSDGFGDRLLMFDNTDAISVELLRFRRSLVTTGFDNALRDRVEHLATFHHPAFPRVRAAVHLDDQDLTLVTAHTPGQRLSELPVWKMRKGVHPAIVTWVVREVTSALAALQASGPFVAHGALNADRVVLTSDGRLCITEHALGAAVRRLRLTPGVLWRQFGLLAPADEKGVVRIDQRSDVVQLATIALGLLLGRPVTLHDFERGLSALLDEFTATAAATPSVFSAPLRAWLERALQLAPRSYRSAKEAQDASRELPVPIRPSTLGHSAPAPTDGDDSSSSAGRGVAALSQYSGHHETERHQRRTLDERSPRGMTLTEPAAVIAANPIPVAATATTPATLPETATERGRWRRAYTIALAVAVTTIAVAEGFVIARMRSAPITIRVTDPVSRSGGAIDAARIPSPERDAISGSSLIPTGADPVVPAVERRSVTDDVATAASSQRAGGVRWSSPIELTVLQGDRVLGSTADGPIVTTPGTHQLELVNTALGFRSRQTVTIRAGVITPLTLTPPTGRLNINAQPWAQVLIDDQPVGETPLANVSVPLGQHQVTFRHPQFGERRETVLVRADAIARVSTSFDR